MNAIKSVGNLGSQMNKLLSIKAAVSSRIFNFQSLATTLSAPLTLKNSISASNFIHTDTPKRKELFGANQCDAHCISNNNDSCNRCDQHCQTLRDQIEANMKDRAIPKVEETIIKPCFESAPKKNQSLSSSNSGGIENKTITTIADGISLENQSNAMTKPITTQPTTINVSEPPHSYSYLLENVDLNPIDFKSETKFSRPKTIRNQPEKESIKIRKTASNQLNQKVTDASCLSIGKSGGESCTTFSTSRIKENDSDHCLNFASANIEAASSLKSAVPSIMPESRSNSLLHLFEQPKEREAVAQISTGSHSTAEIGLSPRRSGGGTNGCGSQSSSSSSSSPCAQICNQPTENSASKSSESNNCQKNCGPPSNDSKKSCCSSSGSNASMNDCSADDKTSICKQICCQALKEIVMPTPRKKTTQAIAPSEPAKSVIKKKTACKKRCGSEQTVDKSCSTNISSPPEYKAGCGPRPVALHCDKPEAPKTECNPDKQCTNANKTSTCGSASREAIKCNAPKTSTCGSASRAAIKCKKSDSNKSEAPKNSCGPNKCMPSQPQRPQNRR